MDSQEDLIDCIEERYSTVRDAIYTSFRAAGLSRRKKRVFLGWWEGLILSNSFDYPDPQKFLKDFCFHCRFMGMSDLRNADEVLPELFGAETFSAPIDLSDCPFRPLGNNLNSVELESTRRALNQISMAARAGPLPTKLQVKDALDSHQKNMEAEPPNINWGVVEHNTYCITSSLLLKTGSFRHLFLEEKDPPNPRSHLNRSSDFVMRTKAERWRSEINRFLECPLSHVFNTCPIADNHSWYDGFHIHRPLLSKSVLSHWGLYKDEPMYKVLYVDNMEPEEFYDIPSKAWGQIRESLAPYHEFFWALHKLSQDNGTFVINEDGRELSPFVGIAYNQTISIKDRELVPVKVSVVLEPGSKSRIVTTSDLPLAILSSRLRTLTDYLFQVEPRLWTGQKMNPIEGAIKLNRMNSFIDTVDVEKSSSDLSEATDRSAMNQARAHVGGFLRAFIDSRRSIVSHKYRVLITALMNSLTIIYGSRVFTRSDGHKYGKHRCGILMGEEASFPVLGLQNLYAHTIALLGRNPQDRLSFKYDRLQHCRTLLRKWFFASQGDDCASNGPKGYRARFETCLRFLGAHPNNKAFLGIIFMYCEGFFGYHQVEDMISIRAIVESHRDRWKRRLSMTNECQRFLRYAENDLYGTTSKKICTEQGRSILLETYPSFEEEVLENGWDIPSHLGGPNFISESESPARSALEEAVAQDTELQVAYVVGDQEADQIWTMDETVFEMETKEELHKVRDNLPDDQMLVIDENRDLLAVKSFFEIIDSEDILLRDRSSNNRVRKLFTQCGRVRKSRPVEYIGEIPRGRLTMLKAHQIRAGISQVNNHMGAVFETSRKRFRVAMPPDLDRDGENTEGSEPAAKAARISL